MKPRRNPFLSYTASLAIACTASANAASLSFDGNQATGVTTHTLNATAWADYVGGVGTFNSANAGGRLYWRGSAGDGQFMHFDLSSLTGLTLVAPVTVTLQDSNPTHGGGVTGSYVATANGLWTAGAGQAVPVSSAIINAVNATGSYGWDAAISWGIGSTTFQGFVDNQSSFYGLGVIGGSGSQMHFDAVNPYLTVKTGTISSATGVITADTGSSIWNASNYSFAASNAYSPIVNTLTINGELASGTSGAGAMTINNGGTVAVNQAGNVNYYWALDGTTVNAGGKLTINGHSNIHNLTLAGGELASSGTDPDWGSWALPDTTNVTGGVTSTISAQKVTLSGGVFNVDSGSTLNFTGSTRAGSLTKNGEGTMTISAYQDYTGGTTVNAGILEVIGQNSGNGWLRNSVTVNSGGTLKFTGGDGTGFGWNSPVTSLTINGGTVNAAGSSHLGFGAYTTAALKDGGTISGSWQWNGDSGLGFSSSGDTTNTISGNLTLRSDSGANHSFDVANGAAAVDLHVSGNLSDQYPDVWWVSAGAMVKTGAGTMVLSGSNSYDGGTAVNVGTLTFANTTARPSTGITTVAAGATLGLGVGGAGYFGAADVTSLFANTMSGVSMNATANVGVDTSAGDFAYTASIAGSPTNGLVKLGAKTLVLSGTNTYTGGTTVNTGTLTFANTAAKPSTGTTTVAAGATLGLGVGGEGYFSQADVSSLFAGTMAGVSMAASSNVGVDTTAGDFSYTDAASGTRGLVKLGANTMTISAYQNYTGGTTVNAGMLEVIGQNSGNGWLRGDVTVNSGGILKFTGGDGTGFGWNSPVTSLTINGGTFDAVGGSHLGFGAYMTIALKNGGTISGSGQWNGNGLLGFTSSGDSTNTISGAWNLRGDNGVDHTFTVNDGAAATDLLVSANLSNIYTVALVKAGAGTMKLTGNSSYYGQTKVNEGTLVAASSGALGPGGWDGNSMTWVYNGATLALDGGISLNEHMHVFGAGVGGNGAIRSLSGTNVLPLTYGNSGSGPGISIDSNTTVGVDAGTLSATGFYETGGSFVLTKVGAGTLKFTQVSTYTGGTMVNAGTLELSSTTANQSAVRGALTVNSGATVNITGSDFTGLGKDGGANVTTLNVSGGTVNTSVHSWLAGATVNLTGGTMNGSGSHHIVSSSLNSKASASTSTISNGLVVRKDYGSSDLGIDVEDGAAATDLLINGNIGEALSAGVTKTGAGTLVLSGTNSYTGPTNVNVGKLVINGDNSSATGAVTVASGATLGGSGTVGGATTIQNGGHLAVGNSVGSQTYNSSLNFESGSIFDWDIDTSSNISGFDTISVTDNIDVATGAIFKVILGGSALTDIQNINNTFWNTPYGTQTWSMSSIFGEAFHSGAFTSVDTNIDVSSYGAFTITGTSLTWTAVPEPTSALASLLLTAGLLRRRRASVSC